MKKNSKKVLVVLVVLILLAMAVAYAATTRTLEIFGTGRVAADISRVEFTDIKCTDGQETLDGEEDARASGTYDADSITFDVTLQEPGDSLEYTSTITNNSNANAIITDVKYYLLTTTETEKTLEEINAADPSAVKFEVDSNLAVGTKIAKGATLDSEIAVYWDSNDENMPDAGESKQMKVEVIFGVDE